MYCPTFRGRTPQFPTRRNILCPTLTIDHGHGHGHQGSTNSLAAETFTTGTSSDTVCIHKNFDCINEVIEDVIRQSVEELTPQPSALSCPQPSNASIRASRFSEEFNLHLSSSDAAVDKPGIIDSNALATTNHLSIPATVKNLNRKYQRRV